MTLLIDVGNTRIKWSILSAHGLGPQHADAYSGWGRVQLRARVLAPAGRAERVLIANVGGTQVAELLRATIRETWGLEPQFVQTAALAGGVRNAYSQPAKLGVDRWLALIGTHALEKRAACIVDVGTAMTIDGIDRAGNHLGGVIVPGPDLMISTLMHNTSDIAVHAQKGSTGETLFADNTLGGVYQGAVHALAALVDKAVQSIRETLGAEPLLLLTGGASDRLERLVTGPFSNVPNLVLRGLAVLAEESSVPQIVVDHGVRSSAD
jgi:type III pantothenate kinase